MLKEAPARKKAVGFQDSRLPCEVPCAVVHCDTLFFTKGKEGNVEEVGETDRYHGMGITMLDPKSHDVEFYPVRSRSTEEFKHALIEFCGSKDKCRTLVSDNAPEFVRGCKDFDMAHFLCTPGRSTSHAAAERANRTVLESLRGPLAQSGLSLTWAARAAQHSLMVRRCLKHNALNDSIYRVRSPLAPIPPIWPFGAAVDFKPTIEGSATHPKAGSRGLEGLLVGYHTNPGGSWSGDFLVVEEAAFRRSAGSKKIRVYRTKTVSWAGDSRPRFPIFEAVEQQKLLQLAQSAPQGDEAVVEDAEPAQVSQSEDDHQRLLDIFEEFTAPVGQEPSQSVSDPS